MKKTILMGIIWDLQTAITLALEDLENAALGEGVAYNLPPVQERLREALDTSRSHLHVVRDPQPEERKYAC